MAGMGLSVTRSASAAMAWWVIMMGYSVTSANALAPLTIPKIHHSRHHHSVTSMASSDDGDGAVMGAVRKRLKSLRKARCTCRPEANPQNE